MEHYLIAKVDHVVVKGKPGGTATCPIELSSDEESANEFTHQQCQVETILTPIRRIGEPYDSTKSSKSTRHLNSREMFENDFDDINERNEPLHRPFIVSIEGIPGSNKSATMAILKERFKGSPDVVILKEPTSIWEEFKLDGTNLLDLYFKDQDRYGLVFQLIYFMAVERQLQRAIRHHHDKRIIVCERSLLSARAVYFEMLPRRNRIKYDVYQTLFQKEGVGNVYPDHIILLDAEPRECVGRSSRKDWRGEEVITLEYLQRCRRHHLEMKKRHSGGWTTISGQLDQINNTVMTTVETIVDTSRTVEINDQYHIPEGVKIVSLEGNIGAGKSTLLMEIEQRCKDRGINEIRILREPIDEWERVTDGAKTILELFYENPAEYGFPFQILVGITTMKRIRQELSDHPDTKVILCERSILSSKEVFAKMLHQDGCLDDIEEKVYQILFNGIENKALIEPAMMMYIDTDLSTCLSRIKLRNRRGEHGITMDELQKCESYQKTMFRQIHTHVKSIDPELEVNGVKINWIDTIIGWCQQLSIGRTPNELTSPVKENLGERDWCGNRIGKEISWDQIQSEIPREKAEDLIEPVRTLSTPTDGQEKLYLIKVRYKSLLYRFALPNWKLTNNRFIQEIEALWPELKDNDIKLEWRQLERYIDGTCEDNHLNESLDYIELMDGKEIDHIIEYDIKLMHKPAESICPSNEAICKETGGGKQL